MLSDNEAQEAALLLIDNYSSGKQPTAEILKQIPMEYKAAIFNDEANTVEHAVIKADLAAMFIRGIDLVSRKELIDFIDSFLDAMYIYGYWIGDKAAREKMQLEKLWTSSNMSEEPEPPLSE